VHAVSSRISSISSKLAHSVNFDVIIKEREKIDKKKIIEIIFPKIISQN
jgi:hypothetical protein